MRAADYDDSRDKERDRRCRVFLVANRVNFRDHAGDRWSASLAPAVALLPGLPVYDSHLFGAHRDSLLGSGQKELGR